MTSAIIEARDLKKDYAVKRFFRQVGTVKALGGVSFRLEAGETLAIVGESGCGKSTLAKLLMRIETPSAGQILIHGQTPEAIGPKAFRKTVQMIFQDPYSSINPRKRAWEIIAEPLLVNSRISHSEARQRAAQMMLKVGLRPEFVGRYPHMFSGGQRQRLGIARALMMEPEVIICDEPVSALDVSIQAQILNLLLDLQREMKLSYIFISHDLSVVEHIADKVMVIYLGKVVEAGDRHQVFHQPQHPYTQTLLAATPRLHGKPAPWPRAVKGELPSRMHLPAGCAFHKRCPYAQERCQHESPSLREVAGRQVACHVAATF